MLIVNSEHLMLAGVCSLDELCPYCGVAFAEYPLIMSDDPAQTVYLKFYSYPGIFGL